MCPAVPTMTDFICASIDGLQGRHSCPPPAHSQQSTVGGTTQSNRKAVTAPRDPRRYNSRVWKGERGDSRSPWRTKYENLSEIHQSDDSHLGLAALLMGSDEWGQRVPAPGHAAGRHSNLLRSQGLVL